MPRDLSIVAYLQTSLTTTPFISLSNLLDFHIYFILLLPSLYSLKKWASCQRKLLATLMVKILRIFWVGKSMRRILTTRSRTHTALSKWV